MLFLTPQKEHSAKQLGYFNINTQINDEKRFTN